MKNETSNVIAIVKAREAFCEAHGHNDSVRKDKANGDIIKTCRTCGRLETYTSRLSLAARAWHMADNEKRA